MVLALLAACCVDLRLDPGMRTAAKAKRAARLRFLDGVICRCRDDEQTTEVVREAKAGRSEDEEGEGGLAKQAGPGCKRSLPTPSHTLTLTLLLPPL